MYSVLFFLPTLYILIRTQLAVTDVKTSSIDVDRTDSILTIPLFSFKAFLGAFATAGTSCGKSKNVHDSRIGLQTLHSFISNSHPLALNHWTCQCLQDKSFCTSCLQECLKPRKPVCGVCRSSLTAGIRALEVEKLIESTESTCRGCDKKVYLSKMRAHVASCSKYQNYMMEGIKAATKDQLQGTRDVPNRFTFPCPYCLEKNFDQDGLVEHCKKSHSLDTRQVVCPICSSMPWGDPNYRSGNFMEHIRRRHKFSYDTFVDYSVDEEAMMNDALMRSLMDK